MKTIYPDGVRKLVTPDGISSDGCRIIRWYPNEALTFNGKIFHWEFDFKTNLATAKFIKGGEMLLTKEETEFILSPSSR